MAENSIVRRTASLAPAGGQGDSVVLQFIKPKTGSIFVIVSGQDVYDDSTVEIREKRFDTVAVNIGDDMLP